jgi:hypothetical protein
MVLGLGTKHSQNANKTTKKDKSSLQAEEAAAFLKKAEEKKNAGECPFC